MKKMFKQSFRRFIIFKKFLEKIKKLKKGLLNIKNSRSVIFENVEYDLKGK